VCSPFVLSLIMVTVIAAIDLDDGQLKGSIGSVLSDDDRVSSHWLGTFDGVGFLSLGQSWECTAEVSSDIYLGALKSITAAVLSVCDLDFSHLSVSVRELGVPPMSSSHSGVSKALHVGSKSILGLEHL